MKTLLCLECGDTFEIHPEAPPMRGCPGCGSQSVPADLADTIDFKITKHELRILTMWAANWAEKVGCKKVIGIILDRLALQTDTALTLSQEIADLRAEYGPKNVRAFRVDIDGIVRELE